MVHGLLHERLARSAVRLGLLDGGQHLAAHQHEDEVIAVADGPDEIPRPHADEVAPEIGLDVLEVFLRVVRRDLPLRRRRVERHPVLANAQRRLAGALRTGEGGVAIVEADPVETMRPDLCPKGLRSEHLLTEALKAAIDAREALRGIVGVGLLAEPALVARASPGRRAAREVLRPALEAPGANRLDAEAVLDVSRVE